MNIIRFYGILCTLICAYLTTPQMTPRCFGSKITETKSESKLFLFFSILVLILSYNSL